MKHTPEHSRLDDCKATGIGATFDRVDRSGSGGGSMPGFGHYRQRHVHGDDGKWRIQQGTLTPEAPG
jgi:hypothetical protein